MRTRNVGTLVAAPGEKTKGRVTVLETPASTLTFPVVIVNAHDPGPGLVLFAGIHGSEYPPIEAASRLGGLLRPDSLRGSVVIFPLINVPGFEACEVNLKKFLKMTEGEPERLHDGHQELFHRDFILRVRHGGIFEPKVGPSVRVTEGEYLGRIKTLDGDTLEEVRSPADGVIRTLFPRRVVHAGSIVYRGWVREPSDRAT